MASRGVKIPLNVDGEAAAVADFKKVDDAIEKIGESAEEAGKKLQKGISGEGVEKAVDAVKDAEAAMRKLGIRSEATAEKQKKAYVDAFEKLKNSGVASSDEIRRAQIRLNDQIERVNKTIGKSSDRFAGLKAAAGKIGTGLKVGFAAAAAGVAATVGAATAAGYAFFNAAKSAADYADAITKMSRKVNVSTEDLSALAFAAEQSGNSQEELFTGLSKLNLNAVRMPKEAEKAFKKIGVSVKDANGKIKDTYKLFREVSDGLSRIKNGSERSAAAIGIFGEQGAKLANLLALGSRGLDEYAARAAKFGKVVGEEAGKNAEAFNDAIDNMNQSWEGVKFSATSGLFDELAEIFNSLADMLAENRDRIANIVEFVGKKLVTLAQDLITLANGGKDIENKWLIELAETLKVIYDLLVGIARALVTISKYIPDIESKNLFPGYAASKMLYNYRTSDLNEFEREQKEGNAVGEITTAFARRSIKSPATASPMLSGGETLTININDKPLAFQGPVSQLRKELRLSGQASIAATPAWNK
jgi:hypothetical protein